jgi:hypothetical protein
MRRVACILDSWKRNMAECELRFAESETPLTSFTDRRDRYYRRCTRQRTQPGDMAHQRRLFYRVTALEDVLM